MILEMWNNLVFFTKLLIVFGCGYGSCYLVEMFRDMAFMAPRTRSIHKTARGQLKETLNGKQVLAPIQRTSIVEAIIKKEPKRPEGSTVYYDTPPIDITPPDEEEIEEERNPFYGLPPGQKTTWTAADILAQPNGLALWKERTEGLHEEIENVPKREWGAAILDILRVVNYINWNRERDNGAE